MKKKKFIVITVIAVLITGLGIKLFPIYKTWTNFRKHIKHIEFRIETAHNMFTSTYERDPESKKEILWYMDKNSLYFQDFASYLKNNKITLNLSRSNDSVYYYLSKNTQEMSNYLPAKQITFITWLKGFQIAIYKVPKHSLDCHNLTGIRFFKQKQKKLLNELPDLDKELQLLFDKYSFTIRDGMDINHRPMIIKGKRKSNGIFNIHKVCGNRKQYKIIGPELINILNKKKYEQNFDEFYMRIGSPKDTVISEDNWMRK